MAFLQSKRTLSGLLCCPTNPNNIAKQGFLFQVARGREKKDQKKRKAGLEGFFNLKQQRSGSSESCLAVAIFF